MASNKQTTLGISSLAVSSDPPWHQAQYGMQSSPPSHEPPAPRSDYAISLRLETLERLNSDFYQASLRAENICALISGPSPTNGSTGKPCDQSSSILDRLDSIIRGLEESHAAILNAHFRAADHLS